MLHHLSIQNYALIRHLELDFEIGFSVITGETGAGKSILLGALDLILGKRADTRVLLDKSAKCIVEGSFDIGKYKLDVFFEKYDLDVEPRTILRREINTQGKSRAFINDTPVKLSILNELGVKLVDIHSQHQSLALSESGFQFAVMDAYAGILEESIKYQIIYRKYLNEKKQLEDLHDREQKSRAEKDYFEFLFQELEDARIKKGEQESLEEELSVLDHADEIRTVLYKTSQGLDDEKGGTLANLNELVSGLSKIKNYNTELEEINNRLESVRIELQDIQNEVNQYERLVELNPERSKEVQERLDNIYSLQQKHRVNSDSELLNVLRDLETKLNGIGNLEERIRESSAFLEKQKNQLNKLAKFISKARKEAIPGFQQDVTQMLTGLGMPNAAFVVAHEPGNHLAADGLDQIRFLFNANKGEKLDDLSRVASGGEKSRLMLAIKSLISKKLLLPTIIFDEIDTGVSGAVADRVGEILLSLASDMQVISITHLPQIAGKGNQHFQVYKHESENLTSTHVKKLNPDERIIEIAKLISGQEVTTASVESARQLLKN